MKAFFRSMQTFRGLGAADVLSYNLCLDSSDGQAGSLVAVGEFARALTGQWLIADGQLYLIDKATPQDGRTQFTLLEPTEAFARPLRYSAPSEGTTAGRFLANVIQSEFIEQADPVYAMPYLAVSSPGTVAWIEPSADADGIYSLPAFIRMLRQLSGLRLNWEVEVDSLHLSLAYGTVSARSIVFDNGHNQLSSAAYSKSGLAKITALQPQDSGQTDADGNPILVSQAIDFYLSEAGEISREPPSRRAVGGWDMITVSATQDALEKVRQTFAKNKASHKVEFYSDRDMAVFDPCSIKLHGEVLVSYISYKGKSSTDTRFLYKSGELATTASEKLRRAAQK